MPEPMTDERLEDCKHWPTTVDLDAITRAFLKDCLAEIDRLRTKNRELNRRSQQANAAFVEAKAALDKHWEWRGGSFGRAMLVHYCTNLEEGIGRLKEENAKLRCRIGAIVPLNDKLQVTTMVLNEAVEQALAAIDPAEEQKAKLLGAKP